MKTKRPRKRYSHDFEIEFAIALAEKKLTELKIEVDSLNDEVKKLMFDSLSLGLNSAQIGDIQVKISDAKRKILLRGIRIKTYEDLKIPRLGRTLAALRTKPMSFIKEGSVTLQE